MIKRGIKYSIIVAMLISSVALFSYAKRNDFGLGRNMEILVNMMRELTLHFVDDIDPDELMKGAAMGMVSNLDPYTEYMPEENMSDFELMTTGKYGGIGALIRKKVDYISIAQPYEGSPADKAGLKIGDKIVGIGGEDAKGFTTEQVSSKLKGTPNTDIEVRIARLMEGDTVNMVITRERIAIPGIPYAQFINDSIGYIKHSDFTDGCYDDMRAEIVKMEQTGRLKGLILDYRSNGGGILQEAVKIVSLFVPKGSEVVTTRGRNDSTVYRTELSPIAPTIPLAVLINGHSASAAEIVSGALQDMDRAVLIGQKSFGKGLVQSTRPLGYNSYLKLTTAKYYMPSGRCIQAIDYSKKGDYRAIEELPDSLKRAFKTEGGRVVYDGGGIMPDIKLEPEYVSRFAMTLYAMGFVEDFVDGYMKQNGDVEIDIKNFTISDDDYKDFAEFMKGKDVPYQSDTRIALKALQNATKSDLFKELETEFKRVETELKDDTQTNLITYKDGVIESINNNVILRHSYQRGLIENNIAHDREVERAADILSNRVEYDKILETREITNEEAKQ